MIGDSRAGSVPVIDLREIDWLRREVSQHKGKVSELEKKLEGQVAFLFKQATQKMADQNRLMEIQANEINKLNQALTSLTTDQKVDLGLLRQIIQDKEQEKILLSRALFEWQVADRDLVVLLAEELVRLEAIIDGRLTQEGIPCALENVSRIWRKQCLKGIEANAQLRNELRDAKAGLSQKGLEIQQIRSINGQQEERIYGLGQELREKITALSQKDLEIQRRLLINGQQEERIYGLGQELREKITALSQKDLEIQQIRSINGQQEERIYGLEQELREKITVLSQKDLEIQQIGLTNAHLRRVDQDRRRDMQRLCDQGGQLRQRIAFLEWEAQGLNGDIQRLKQRNAFSDREAQRLNGGMGGWGNPQ